MKLSRFATGLAAIAIALAPASALALDGSGTQKTEVRTLTTFTSVECDGALDLNVTCGKTLHCEVTADDNLLPVIATTVEGGTLKIHATESISTRTGITVTLDTPDVSAVKLSGAGTVKVNGLKNDAFELGLSGTAHVIAAGQTKKLKIGLSGAGKIDADGLATDDADVDCSGAGAVDVHVSGTLNAKVSGVGKVMYGGSPKTVNKDVSGVGSIGPR